MREGTLIKDVYDVMNNLNDEELLSVSDVARIVRETCNTSDTTSSVNTSLNTLEKRGLIIRSDKTTDRGGKLYRKSGKKVIKVNMSSWLKK